MTSQNSSSNETLILACETSTLLGSVSLISKSSSINQDNQANIKILASIEQMRQGSHSDFLNLMINEVLVQTRLTLKDIDLFASGLGPGSFTGIRISVNTIKTLAYIHDKPVLSLDSLTNIAYRNLPLVPEQAHMCVMINAFKNMVYLALFKKENAKLKVLTHPQVCRVQELHNILSLGTISQIDQSDELLTEKNSNTLNQTTLEMVYEKKIPQFYFVGDGYLAYENYLKQNYSKALFRPDSLIIDYPHASAFFDHLKFQDDQRLEVKNLHWSDLLPLYLRDSEAEENLRGIKYQAL